MATLSLSASHASLRPPPSPAMSSSSSSSKSLYQEDEENITIIGKMPLSNGHGPQKSQEDDLRLLAISTHMTELSYTISDIQTRIFEIQELRHKSQASGDTAGTTAIIDQSLMSLDERIETVSKGMKSISDSLEPILQNPATPTRKSVILRKHATLAAEWEAVQDESDVLREELKEDKWLTVFRTVTDQADGMMSSLEKAVNRCQEFIWQVHRRSEDHLLHSTSSDSSQRSDKAPTYEVYTSLLESHYMPATSKVLSIIDKGVRDRVTKNGETLRRHAESAQRWKSLKERITRTDTEMEIARKLLLGDDPSENGSNVSGTTSHTRNGYLNTPPNGSRRSGSAASTISRSISPFRKFARKITGTTNNTNNLSRTPSSEPPPSSSQNTARRTRTSIFGGQSLTPDSSPRGTKVYSSKTQTATSSAPVKQRWNSSTKVESDDRTSTVKGTPPKRSPSAAGTYGDMTTSISGTFRRSFSRTSMASSRPWSPVTSSISTTQSSSRLPTQPSRAQTPSRSQTPSRPQTPSRAGAYTPAMPMTPRARPKTPSHIPAPSNKLMSIVPPMSAAARAQTPEFALRARVQQLPVAGKSLPPSSFRESASRTPSRSGSRTGSYTPTGDNLPLHDTSPTWVNSIAHGLLVERVDPPLKKLPKEGEEQKAQYAFSNALSRKVITCRLTTLTRPGKADIMVTKKVIHYILNRQAGM
ncbi:hypothetical protein B0H14DRAFT_2707808 [Mycena olivaceomarginata]|nr:hypothetical protein B0H14DRAFT_2707808 [Mycena olivaceomarginata]